MRTVAIQKSVLLSFAAGTSLALAFAFEIAESLAPPFAWHFAIAALLFALAIALQRAFLTELVERSQRGAIGAGCVLDAGLAMFVWALAALSLVRGICALLPK